MGDMINTKLYIYESCDAGYITEDEKFELLSILEASNNKIDDEEARKKELIKKIKKTTVAIVGIIAILVAIKKLSGIDASLKNIDSYNRSKRTREDDNQIDIDHYIRELREYADNMRELGTKLNNGDSNNEYIRRQYDKAIDNVNRTANNISGAVKKYGTPAQMKRFNELLDSANFVVDSKIKA